MPNPSNKPLSKLDRVVANAQRLADKGRVHPDVPDFYRESGGRGQTAPSSQVKKTKMSDRKLSKMGAGINTGLTAERNKILKAIQRLPAAQQRKIYEALEGYAMD